jgi:hypothetical protein
VPIRCCLPADGRTASLLPVHKHVDDLCATAPSLCIDGGNAGDSAGQPEPEEGIYLGERESCLCIQGKSVIIHMPRCKKWRMSRMFIRGLSGCDMACRSW